VKTGETKLMGFAIVYTKTMTLARASSRKSRMKFSI